MYAGSLFTLLEVTHPNEPAEVEAVAGGDVAVGEACMDEEVKEDLTCANNDDQQMADVD